MPGVGVRGVPRENRVVAAERLFRPGRVLERERAREERLSLRQI
jgi:hypothetical protein